MRFAKNTIHLEIDGRRFVAAFKGQPIPAHLDHLIGEADTTETAPSAAASAAAAADPGVDAATSAAAEEDLETKLIDADDHELVLLSAIVGHELDRRGLNKTEVEVPDGVVPGETPGWPVVNGEVLDLPEAVREELAEKRIVASVDYDDLDKEALQDLIERRKETLTEIKGTGKNGNVLKEDLVAALTAADRLALDEA